MFELNIYECFCWPWSWVWLWVLVLLRETMNCHVVNWLWTIYQNFPHANTDNLPFLVIVQGSLCFHWMLRRKKVTRKQSQLHIHMPSSTWFSLLLACILQCFWQVGLPLLERVVSWLTWGGLQFGFELSLAGQLLCYTYGLS